MRKIVKRGLTLGLSLMLGVAGNLGGVSILYSGTVAVKAAVEESGQKAITSGIDILDYESNVSATEFVVNDITGMEKLAELVNSGTEDFTGKTVRLTADLKYDKTIENNQTTIGVNNSKSFKGMFDGGYHTISGINKKNTEECGLFQYIMKDGVIKKVVLSDSVMIHEFTRGENVNMTVGGIVDFVDRRALVEKCIVRENVRLTGGRHSLIGGIAGDVDGSIKKCINYATVTGSCYVGGIASGVDGNMMQCVNYGDVICKGSQEEIGSTGYFFCCGGLTASGSGSISESANFGNIFAKECTNVGGITGDGWRVINCFNTGNVFSEQTVQNEYKCYVGGISGGHDQGGSRHFINSYSIGEVKNGWVGAISAVSNASHFFQNCYWLTGTADVAVYIGPASCIGKGEVVRNDCFERDQTNMQSQDFVNELNENSVAEGYENVWAMDYNNINNGYPILKNTPYTIDNIINDPEDNTDREDENLDLTLASHFYEDHNYNTQATNSTIRIYANGGTVTVPGTTEKKNYKRCVLYTDILPSYIYTVGKNGAIKPSSGKVVVGITASNQKPELVKGKIVDKSTSKIASASIKSGQITVTAKSQPGKVYLWVIDTGKAAVAACIPVTVKGAPTATYLYAVPDTDTFFAYGKTKQFKSGKVGIGESVKVYLYPAYKQIGAVQKAKNVKYTASVAANAADYFTVTQSGSNPYCFEIRAKGLKSGKSVTGAITFTCNLNGKKAVFKATATNPVTSISTANENGLTKKADNSFSIKASDTAKISGTFELKPVYASNTDATTDKLKIYAMGSENGYDAAKLKEGKIKITTKKSSAQGKISMKSASDKKTVTVIAAKGTKPVTAYFLVVYNTISDGAKKGYTVISVTAE